MLDCEVTRSADVEPLLVSEECSSSSTLLAPSPEEKSFTRKRKMLIDSWKTSSISRVGTQQDSIPNVKWLVGKCKRIRHFVESVYKKSCEVRESVEQVRGCLPFFAVQDSSSVEVTVISLLEKRMDHLFNGIRTLVTRIIALQKKRKDWHIYNMSTGLMHTCPEEDTRLEGDVQTTLGNLASELSELVTARMWIGIRDKFNSQRTAFVDQLLSIMEGSSGEVQCTSQFIDHLLQATGQMEVDSIQKDRVLKQQSKLEAVALEEKKRQKIEKHIDELRLFIQSCSLEIEDFLCTITETPPAAVMLRMQRFLRKHKDMVGGLVGGTDASKVNQLFIARLEGLIEEVKNIVQVCTRTKSTDGCLSKLMESFKEIDFSKSFLDISNASVTEHKKTLDSLRGEIAPSLESILAEATKDFGQNIDFSSFLVEAIGKCIDYNGILTEVEISQMQIENIREYDTLFGLDAISAEMKQSLEPNLAITWNNAVAIWNQWGHSEKDVEAIRAVAFDFTSSINQHVKLPLSAYLSLHVAHVSGRTKRVLVEALISLGVTDFFQSTRLPKLLDNNKDLLTLLQPFKKTVTPKILAERFFEHEQVVEQLLPEDDGAPVIDENDEKIMDVEDNNDQPSGSRVTML